MSSTGGQISVLISKEHRGMMCNDIREYLMSTHHLRDTTDFALYSRDRQADIIHAAKDVC